MSARFLIATVAVCSLAIACTPSPTDTCHRLEALSAKDPGGFKLSWNKCMDRMNEMKERDPEAYRCTAKTVAKLESIDTALLAVSVCDHRSDKDKHAKAE